MESSSHKGIILRDITKTTSLAHPKPSCSFVSSAVSLIIWPMSLTASIFIPALVVAIFIEEQTLSVWAKLWGIDLISFHHLWSFPYEQGQKNPR